MRLSEEKIKQGILHPERIVREAAIRYFADSFSPDPSIMPLVIQAIETYGWQEACLSSSYAKGLVQTDETVRWLIGELGRRSEIEAEGHEWASHNYLLGLSLALASADAELLCRYSDQAMQVVEQDAGEIIADRVDLLSADPEDCWQRLEEFREENKSEDDLSEVNLDHGFALAEAVVRGGNRFADRVLTVLRAEIDEFEDNPLVWMELFAVRLAGLLRLEAAVPLLVEKLKIEADWLREECVDALTAHSALHTRPADSVCPAASNFPGASPAYQLHCGRCGRYNPPPMQPGRRRPCPEQERCDDRSSESCVSVRQLALDGGPRCLAAAELGLRFPDQFRAAGGHRRGCGASGGQHG